MIFSVLDHFANYSTTFHNSLRILHNRWLLSRLRSWVYLLTILLSEMRGDNWLKTLLLWHVLHVLLIC